MKTTDEIMGLVAHYGNLLLLANPPKPDKSTAGFIAEMQEKFNEIRAALTALASGECSVAGLADDLRLVAQLESKRMGAMSSGLLKGVIDRLSALPPPPAEGEK